MNDKTFVRAMLNSLLINETLIIVINEHPEILAKAMVQLVDKYPELFKDALEKVKKDAEIHQEDH